MNSERQKSDIPPLALWIGVLGAGAAGVSGVGSIGQLGQINTSIEETVRQAEFRGMLQAEIQEIRGIALRNKDAISNTMPREGVIQLHKTQQSLIDKLIDATTDFATKNELNLAISKLRNAREE